MAELTEATKLESQREAAATLNCRLVYALVIFEPLDQIVRERRAAKAHVRFAPVAQGMMLESQSLTGTSKDEAHEHLTAKILNEPLRYLWDDER